MIGVFFPFSSESTPQCDMCFDYNASHSLLWAYALAVIGTTNQAPAIAAEEELPAVITTWHPRR